MAKRNNNDKQQQQQQHSSSSSLPFEKSCVVEACTKGITAQTVFSEKEYGSRNEKYLVCRECIGVWDSVKDLAIPTEIQC